MNDITPAQWQEIKEIVADALEMPEAEQTDFVRLRCGECLADPDTVLELLSFSNSPGLASLASPDAADGNPDAAGQQIGHYRVIRQLGQGGMGIVYLAHRTDEYQQEVAIKVLLPGVESEQILRRFLAERQFLADLSHPSIVHMIDGGTTADGVSYIVMEYVDGQPITAYCQERNLDLRARLGLFRKLCAAVQYAHQHLVVHRDLKPSNVLVTPDGVLKLLDFGIAKQLRPDQQSSAKTTVLAITPEFASPEQVRGEPITTATDIYSLGVILYELLTGLRPYRLPDRVFQEMARVICEEEPERPSTAVAKHISKQKAESSSNVPATASWLRKLKGDLDTIVLMALRKEPERRYSSVERFSEDIAQFLGGLPVHAQPDTWTYRTGKFVRRNRLAVIAGVALALSVSTGIGATVYQMHREQVQRTRAEDRLADVHRLANTLLFDVHDQIRDLPGSTPARKHIVEVALRYLTLLERDSAADPSLQRDLALAYEKVGDIQGNPRGPNLGDSAAALASYRRALEIRLKLKAPGDADWKQDLALARNYSRIADILWANDEPGNLAYYQAGEKIVSSLASTHAKDPDVLHMWASSEDDLGDLCLEKDDYSCAERYFRQSLDAALKLLAVEPDSVASESDVALAHMKIGRVFASRHDMVSALQEQREALAVRAAYVTNHPQNATARRELSRSYAGIGSVQETMGDLSLAIASYQQAVDTSRKLSDADASNHQFKDDLDAESKQLEAAKRKMGKLRKSPKESASTPKQD
jgi:non-specific serine/threonine protein kinase/serine/threonine-protein kinase